MTETDLFQEQPFGVRCRDIIRDDLKKNGKDGFWERVPGLLDSEYARRHSAAPEAKLARQSKRDELFAEFLAVFSLNLSELTTDARRIAAVSLAGIRKACPNLTRAELDRRAAAYRRKYPSAALTPKALANHWAEFPISQTRDRIPDANAEPPDWRDRAFKLWGDIELPASWSDLSYAVRMDLVR